MILVYPVIALALIYGWLMNLLHVFTIEGTLTTTETLSVVGVFLFPLGGVMGWIV